MERENWLQSEIRRFELKAKYIDEQEKAMTEQKISSTETREISSTLQGNS